MYKYNFHSHFSLIFFFLFHFISSCASCHSSCATCNGSAESQCITCRSGRFAFEGKCLNSCPDTYYGDKKRQECMPCPTGCATCTNNGFCLTCKENWIKNKKNRCMSKGSDNCDECKFFSSSSFFIYMSKTTIFCYFFIFLVRSFLLLERNGLFQFIIFFSI